MINREEQNILLAQTIAKYAVFGKGKSIETISKKLPTISSNDVVTINKENPLEYCKSLIEQQGKILEYDEVGHKLIAMVGSGFSDLNPTILVLSVIDNKVFISASAKEGLIKQHSAEKAIKKFIQQVTTG